MSLASNITTQYNVCSHIISELYYIMYEFCTLVHGLAILNYINLNERMKKKTNNLTRYPTSIHKTKCRKGFHSYSIYPFSFSYSYVSVLQYNIDFI